MPIYNAQLDEPASADSPFNGGKCSTCRADLGREFIYQTDDAGQIIACWHAECQPTE